MTLATRRKRFGPTLFALGVIAAGHGAIAQPEAKSRRPTAKAPRNQARRPEDLAKARLAIAREVYGHLEEELKAPPAGGIEPQKHLFSVLERMVTWSRRWAEAEGDASVRDADKLAAMGAHIKRLTRWEDELERLAQGETSGENWMMFNTMRFHRLEAEYRLASATAARPPAK